MRKLVAGDKLSTNMLKPLGISFESFLQLAQRDDYRAIHKQLVALCAIQLASAATDE